MPISYGRVHLLCTCDWKRNNKAGTKRIESCEIYPVPTTKKDVRSFLELTGYYRRFIPNYATIAKPLTDLTHGFNTEKCTRKYSIECDVSRSFSDVETDITNQSNSQEP